MSSTTTTQEKAKEEPAVPPASSVDKESADVKEDEHSGETSSCKKTLGEELFLVHLNRFAKLERSPDDFDHTTNPKEVVDDETVPAEAAVEAPAASKAEEAEASSLPAVTANKESTCSPPPTKIRAASIGEELWEVHCRRTQGLPPDYDEDDDDKKMKNATNGADAAAKKTTGGNKKKAGVLGTAGATTTTNPKRAKKVMAVEHPAAAREIHLRNRDVKVATTTKKVTS